MMLAERERRVERVDTSSEEIASMLAPPPWRVIPVVRRLATAAEMAADQRARESIIEAR